VCDGERKKVTIFLILCKGGCWVNIAKKGKKF